MKYTDNLNLKKPEQTEFYNVDDFNDNADKLDEAINGLNTRVTPIKKGGTGANNASQACANLGAVRTVNNQSPDSGGNVAIDVSIILKRW